MDIGTKIGRRLDRLGLWTIPIAIGVVVSVGFGSLYFLDRMLRNSDAYALAMDATQSSNQARALLGDPIEQVGLVSGSLVVQSGGTGAAMLQIPVEGSAGSGILHANVSRNDSVWRLSALVLQRFDPEQAVDLLKEPTAPPADVAIGRPSIRPHPGRNESPNSR